MTAKNDERRAYKALELVEKVESRVEAQEQLITEVLGKAEFAKAKAAADLLLEIYEELHMATFHNVETEREFERDARKNAREAAALGAE